MLSGLRRTLHNWKGRALTSANANSRQATLIILAGTTLISICWELCLMILITNIVFHWWIIFVLLNVLKFGISIALVSYACSLLSWRFLADMPIILRCWSSVPGHLILGPRLKHHSSQSGLRHRYRRWAILHRISEACRRPAKRGRSS